MRNTIEHGITVDGNLPGKSVDLSFDSSAIAHLMTVLIDLYSDPELAVIREYSTNAFDSHVAAGNSAPIEVTLPGPLSREFRVKDYGVGLSRDEIESIYSKYGASTKRATDEQVGMLGLGCKSGLTYADAFTMTAVKNGKRNVAVISRKTDGTGNILIQNERDTDEPDGVEVRMSVRDVNSFVRTANNFFRFWQPGTVLVNGAEPKRIQGTWLDDNHLLVRDGLTSDYIVMGNVAYPVGDGHSLSANAGLNYRAKVVSWVPIGDVHFTPNREALHYTTHTKQTISRENKNIARELTKAAQRDIDSADTHAEALRKRAEWWGLLSSRGTYTYRGVTIPHTVQFLGYEFHGSRWNSYARGINEVRVESLFDGVVVAGFTEDSGFFTGWQKRKLRTWMEQQGIASKTVYMTDKLQGAPWTDHMPVYQYDDVKKTKVNNNAAKKQPGQRAGNFDVYHKGKWEVMQQIPAGEVIYFSSADYDDYNFPMKVVQHFPDAYVVKLAKNRWEKFQRDFPHAVTVQAAVRKRQEAILSSTDRDVIAFMAASYGTRELAERFDPSEFIDPELARKFTVLRDKSIEQKADAFAAFSQFASSVGCLIDTSKVPGIDFTEYPLLNWGDRVTKKHVYEYCNAVYTHRQKEN